MIKFVSVSKSTKRRSDVYLITKESRQTNLNLDKKYISKLKPLIIAGKTSNSARLHYRKIARNKELIWTNKRLQGVYFYGDLHRLEGLGVKVLAQNLEICKQSAASGGEFCNVVFYFGKDVALTKRKRELLLGWDIVDVSLDE